MTGAHPRERIDQMFFGWSQYDGAQTALADSFGDRDERQRWVHNLRAHVRLQRMSGAELPDAALSYFTFADGTAALLRRVTAGVTAGRNNSHALIGMSEVLTPRVALGLYTWKGWLADPPAGPLSPIPSGLAGKAALQADKKLFPVASAHSATLVPILAGVLADPRTPITVIGCPEELKAAMIWALVEISERSPIGLTDRTFSTYEKQHDGGDRPPHILFLPERPYDRTEVSRTIVDLLQPATAGRDIDHARMLCQQLVTEDWGSATHRPAPPEPARGPVVDGTPASPEESLVVALREAYTLHDFDQVLTELQQRPAGRRHLVRSALDATALDAAALRVEVTFRDELLSRLLSAAYGPDLADLEDPRAQKHAAEVVTEGDSEQLALLLATAKGASRTRIPDEAFRQWTGRARNTRTVPAARLLGRLQNARRARYLPVAVAIAVAAVLTVAFLSGLIVGGLGTGTAATGEPPTPVGGRIAGFIAQTG
ncbi:hypothetical protein AB0G04_08390 [Actinoplanes sp. NPDC023801]|uniref:hypothetical protein n=1 Tax=Actinoplanes sp. NPDC023801 TaxID=3154595 RepID=UPI0033EDBDA4